MEDLLSIDVDSSSEETESQCSDCEDTDTHVHNKGEFFGCYLLVSKSSKVEPSRPTCTLGSLWIPTGGSNSTMVVVTWAEPDEPVVGDHCSILAPSHSSIQGEFILLHCIIITCISLHKLLTMTLWLPGFFTQFEWAWQHPSKSRRLGKSMAKRRSKESPFQYRFRVVTEMLSVGPWNGLPLTIRWEEHVHPHAHLAG